MASAMDTDAPQRYRAVVTYKKIGPDTSHSNRDDMRNKPWVASSIDTWEARWAEDDRTIGKVSQYIVGHYDTMRPVKQGTNKFTRGLGDNYKILSVQFQVAPLNWVDCDDKSQV